MACMFGDIAHQSELAWSFIYIMYSRKGTSAIVEKLFGIQKEPHLKKPYNRRNVVKMEANE